MARASAALGEMLDLGVKLDLVQKSGSWFNMGEIRLGQGRDAAKQYFRDHPDEADKLEAAIRRDFHKLMSSQSKIAAKAAGRAVDVSADDFDDDGLSASSRPCTKRTGCWCISAAAELLRITPEELLRFDLRPGMDLAEDVLEELNRAAARSLTPASRRRSWPDGRMLSQKELSDAAGEKGHGPAGGSGDRPVAGGPGCGGRRRLCRGHRAALLPPWATAPAGCARSCSTGGCPGSCGTTPWPGCRTRRRPLTGFLTDQAAGARPRTGRTLQQAVRRPAAPGLLLAGYPARPGPAGPGAGGLTGTCTTSRKRKHEP